MYFIINLLCNSHKYLCVKHVNKYLKIRLHIMPILICYLLLLPSSLLHFDFTIFIFWYSLSIWKTHWEVLQLAKLGKPCSADFLTVANTINI